MSKIILNLSLAGCAFSVVSATCAFGEAVAMEDKESSCGLEKNTEGLKEFDTVSACLESIKKLPSDERPSFGQKEWIKDERGTFVYEDKIYDPDFWKSPVNKKLEKISPLNNEEKLKIIKLLTEKEQVCARDLYKNKLFDLNTKIYKLWERAKNSLNFYNFLVENTKKKSVFSRILALFFESTKKLDDPDLQKCCIVNETNKISMEDIVFEGDSNIEKLRNALLLMSKSKEKCDLLEKEYNQLISKILEIFKENFSNAKEILVNFYGEDFKNKFDCDEINFNDESIPKEVKILANAQKILRIDLDKFLCG